MSHFRKLHQTCLVVSTLVLMLAGFESLSYGVGECLGGCSPDAPCPCAADGVCRPKRATWGYSRTRWRTWPGEEAAQQPTRADGAPGSDPSEPLVPYETPPADQEDLRGPAKAKVDRSNDDAEGDVEEPASLLPSPDAIPAFDPQSNEMFEVPPMEDAPPALPASLRQAALQLSRPKRVAQRNPAIVTPVVRQPVQQATWVDQPAIALINPASAVVEPEGETLQQAIYFEASDLGDE